MAAFTITSFNHVVAQKSKCVANSQYLVILENKNILISTA